MVGGCNICAIQLTIRGWLHSPTGPARCLSCCAGTASSVARACCCVGAASSAPAPKRRLAVAVAAIRAVAARLHVLELEAAIDE